MKTEIVTDEFSNDANEQVSKKKLSDKAIWGLATAGILLGGTAWKVIDNPSEPSAKLLDKQSLEVAEPIKVAGGLLTPTKDLSIAHTVNEKMSFEQAFEAARNETGPGGVFQWHGHIYNTYLKEEWTGLSLVQRQEFLHEAGFHPTTITHHEEIPVHHVAENTHHVAETTKEPIFSDRIINGERVVAIDLDGDGVIDKLVSQAPNGMSLIYADMQGDEGLDTYFVYDTVKEENVLVGKMEHPLVMTNASFNATADSYEVEVMNKISQDFENISENLEHENSQQTNVEVVNQEQNHIAEEAINNHQETENHVAFDDRGYEETPDYNPNGNVQDFE